MRYIDEYPALHKIIQRRVLRREATEAEEERVRLAQEALRRQEALQQWLAEQVAQPAEEVGKTPLPANGSQTVRSKKRKRSQERRRFLKSVEWLELRKIIFARDGEVCIYCGSVERLQIDHIKPRSIFPELALEPTNLQVLCWPCNKKKAAKH